MITHSIIDESIYTFFGILPNKLFLKTLIFCKYQAASMPS